MGETCAYHICGQDVSYDPGIWFNSAKFIDIEYQVYGHISTREEENYKSIYWEHPEGEKSLRISFREDNQSVLGFNLMGLRFRHEVCEKWIREKAPLSTVLKQLPLANFDPEFYQNHESEILSSFSDQLGERIQSTHQSKLDQVLAFLKG